MIDGCVAVADELAMRTLLARYAHYADAADLDRFASLFVADGSWTRENSPPAALGGSGLPSQTVTGHAQLRRMIEESIVMRFRGLVRHQMTDILIEPGAGPDSAHGLCRALVTDWRDGPGRIAMCATYRSEFVRTPEGWRFRSIRVAVLPAA